MKRLKALLTKLHNNDAGAMSVEKILILAVIALPIIVLLYAFRKTIVEWFQGQQQKLGDGQ